MAVKKTPNTRAGNADGATRFPYDDEVRNPYDDEVKNPHEETSTDADAEDSEPAPARRKATRAVSKASRSRRRATNPRADK